eukprot:EG_transcript_4502
MACEIANDDKDTTSSRTNNLCALLVPFEELRIWDSPRDLSGITRLDAAATSLAANHELWSFFTDPVGPLAGSVSSLHAALLGTRAAVDTVGQEDCVVAVLQRFGAAALEVTRSRTALTHCLKMGLALGRSVAATQADVQGIPWLAASLSSGSCHGTSEGPFGMDNSPESLSTGMIRRAPDGAPAAPEHLWPFLSKFGTARLCALTHHHWHQALRVTELPDILLELLLGQWDLSSAHLDTLAGLAQAAADLQPLAGDAEALELQLRAAEQKWAALRSAVETDLHSVLAAWETLQRQDWALQEEAQRTALVHRVEQELMGRTTVAAEFSLLRVRADYNQDAEDWEALSAEADVHRGPVLPQALRRQLKLATARVEKSRAKLGRMDRGLTARLDAWAARSEAAKEQLQESRRLRTVIQEAVTSLTGHWELLRSTAASVPLQQQLAHLERQLVGTVARLARQAADEFQQLVEDRRPVVYLEALTNGVLLFEHLQVLTLRADQRLRILDTRVAEISRLGRTAPLPALGLSTVADYTAVLCHQTQQQLKGLLVLLTAVQYQFSTLLFGLRYLRAPASWAQPLAALFRRAPVLFGEREGFRRCLPCQLLQLPHLVMPIAKPTTAVAERDTLTVERVMALLEVEGGDGQAGVVAEGGPGPQLPEGAGCWASAKILPAMLDGVWERLPVAAYEPTWARRVPNADFLS